MSVFTELERPIVDWWQEQRRQTLRSRKFLVRFPNRLAFGNDFQVRWGEQEILEPLLNLRTSLQIMASHVIRPVQVIFG